MAMNPTLQVGDLLVRPKTNSAGIINHFGILIGWNEVLQNCEPKGEHIVEVTEFAQGEEVKVIRTGADPAAVATRASKIRANPKRYDLFGRNCEHTVSEVLWGIARSPQLSFVLVLLTLCGIVLLLRKR